MGFLKLKKKEEKQVKLISPELEEELRKRKYQPVEGIDKLWRESVVSRASGYSNDELFERRKNEKNSQR